MISLAGLSFKKTCRNLQGTFTKVSVFNTFGVFGMGWDYMILIDGKKFSGGCMFKAFVFSVLAGCCSSSANSFAYFEF